MHSCAAYSWSPRGHHALLAVHPSSWSMNFIIALSKSKIEGIIASTVSINKTIFMWFLRDVWKNIQKDETSNGKEYFIFDNSKVHCNEPSQNFMKKYGIRWISIPPYSPQLNPAEKIIGVIKKKKKESWIDSKPLNLQLVKRIVDEISEETWSGWILSSRNESFKKIKVFRK